MEGVPFNPDWNIINNMNGVVVDYDGEAGMCPFLPSCCCCACDGLAAGLLMRQSQACSALAG